MFLISQNCNKKSWGTKSKKQKLLKEQNEKQNEDFLQDVYNFLLTSYENGVLTLDDHSDAGGYTLDTGDIVTAYFKTGLETAFMYPVSALKGMVATDTDTTTLHFASIVGSATDDVVTIEHTAAKFEDICKMMNDACNAYPRDGRIISVIDGHDGYVRTLHPGNPAGITTIEYAPEGGAAGMAT